MIYKYNLSNCKKINLHNYFSFVSLMSCCEFFKMYELTCPVAVAAALTVALLIDEVTFLIVPNVFDKATFC